MYTCKPAKRGVNGLLWQRILVIQAFAGNLKCALNRFFISFINKIKNFKRLNMLKVGFVPISTKVHNLPRQKTLHLEQNKRAMFILASIFGVFLLSGCSGFVSVDEKFDVDTGFTGTHTVQRGETLYSIAWRYGADYKELAGANSIYYPYTIYPGQQINIGRRVASTPAATPPRTLPTKTLTPPAKQDRPVVTKPVRALPVTPPSAPSADDPSWIWPTNGQVIAKFSSNQPVNKGIDIAGSMGEPVLAAAAGTVVYAGNGLLGYGNLVIVKHNDRFLSAYAHNSKLLVQENQEVKVSQPIAEIGSSGTDKTKLHFEIRLDGKPVDPLTYLPRK